jgi:penicillin amidase
VCHVEGDDRAEALELMGYAHGRNRGMQMLLMRILGQGRGAELLDAGDEMVAIDTFFRRMNWSGAASKEVEKFSPVAGEIAEACNRGVTRAFTEKTPLKFKLLGYKPEEWHTDDKAIDRHGRKKVTIQHVHKNVISECFYRKYNLQNQIPDRSIRG